MVMNIRDVLLEGPADFGSLEAHLAEFAESKRKSTARGCRVGIVADELCNTLADIKQFVAADAADFVHIKAPDIGAIHEIAEAVQICHQDRIGAYVDGSCSETDLSARVSVHIAVATQADMRLAKPGLGMDEEFTIVGNEQSRLLAELRSRHALDSDR